MNTNEELVKFVCDCCKLPAVSLTQMEHMPSVFVYVKPDGKAHTRCPWFCDSCVEAL